MAKSKRRGLIVWSTLGIASLCLALFVLRQLNDPGEAPIGSRLPRRLPAVEKCEPVEGISGMPVLEWSPEASDSSGPEEDRIAGDSRFQRRLVAGARFREIADALEHSQGKTHQHLGTYWRLSRFLLMADGPVLASHPLRGISPSELDEKLWEACEDLSLCRTGRLRLANPPSPGGPLGIGVHVRIWTLDGEYPEGEIAAAEANIRRIERVVGISLPVGYDVIVTPRRGDEVLPEQGGASWAAGMYFCAGRYCTLRSSVRQHFRPEVLKHEVIHSFNHRHRPYFITSTFVDEGLAEYLRFLRPGDDRLRVPAGRMQNELVRFFSLVEEMRVKGLDLSPVDPRWLVRIRSAGFYDHRDTSYLAALAAMAFIGGDKIEESFHLGTDLLLVEAVKAIDWEPFLAFIETVAKGGLGDEAQVVQDSVDRSLPGTRGGYGGLEVQGTRDRSPSRTEAEFIADPELVAPALALVESERERLVVLADRSEGSTGPFRLEEDSPALAEPFTAEVLRSPDRRGFLRNLLGVFRSGTEVTVPLFAMSEEPAAVDVDEAAQLPYTALGLPGLLRKRRGGDLHLLFLVGSRDEAVRARVAEAADPASGPLDEEARLGRLAELYRDEFARLGARIRSALVVDLSDGESDALPLAVGLSALRSHRGAVAYWNPQGE